jgi:hypothetical protein
VITSHQLRTIRVKSIQSINQPMITVKLQFDTNRLREQLNLDKQNISKTQGELIACLRNYLLSSDKTKAAHSLSAALN